MATPVVTAVACAAVVACVAATAAVRATVCVFTEMAVVVAGAVAALLAATVVAEVAFWAVKAVLVASSGVVPLVEADGFTPDALVEVADAPLTACVLVVAAPLAVVALAEVTDAEDEVAEVLTADEARAVVAAALGSAAETAA